MQPGHDGDAVRGSSGSRPAQDDVKATEVGAERTSAWLALFAAADQLVGLDFDATSIVAVVTSYLECEWWREDPFDLPPATTPGT